MGKSKKDKWRQVYAVIIRFPSLMDSPDRWVMLTVFTTSKKGESPFLGRLRVYILNSSEQADKMLEENPDYQIKKDFLQDVKNAVKNEYLPLADFAGLPPTEMTENTEIGAYVALNTFQRMSEQQAKKEEKAEPTVEENPFVSWGKKEKPKA